MHAQTFELHFKFYPVSGRVQFTVFEPKRRIAKRSSHAVHKSYWCIRNKMLSAERIDKGYILTVLTIYFFRDPSLSAHAWSISRSAS